jgi:hypothetical protein
VPTTTVPAWHDADPIFLRPGQRMRIILR